MRLRSAERSIPFLAPFTVLAESLFATLFPASCRLCGDPLLNISRLPVCTLCLDNIVPISGVTCEICGERLLAPAFADRDARIAPRCGICSRYRQPYRKAVAYASYDGELRELIHLLKYSRVLTAVDPLARYLASAIRSLAPELRAASSPVIAVTVPLHRAKHRARGFNQTDLVARRAFKLLSRAGFSPQIQLRTDLLERTRPTETQTGLTRHQRRENLRGAFRVAAPQHIAGRTVLLTDDVFTTGTTIAECARTLVRAGAKDVFAVTVARVYKFTSSELDRWNFAEQLPSGVPQIRTGTSEHPKG